MLNNSILLTSIFNPFDHNNRITERKSLDPKKSAKEYIKDAYPDANLFDFVVALNGKKIDEDKLETTYLRSYDSLTVCAIPRGGGGGGKNIFKTVAMIAVMVVATYVTAGAGGTWAAGSIQATMAGAATAMGGSLLVNAIFPVPTPDIGGKGDYGEQSSNNSWDVANPTKEGTAFPVLFGERRIAPAVISKHITIDGDKHYLNVLYAVHDGEIDWVDEPEINDNPIKNFQEVQTDMREGSVDQEMINWFNDTIYERPVNSKLDMSLDTVSEDASADISDGEWGPIMETPENTTRISMVLNFPNGLGVRHARYRHSGGDAGKGSDRFGGNETGGNDRDHSDLGRY